jgi:hypothetical protein
MLCRGLKIPRNGIDFDDHFWITREHDADGTSGYVKAVLEEYDEIRC